MMERNYTRLDSLLRETQIMFDNGFAEKIDVSRVKIQYNSLKAEFENFKPMVALSESLLKFQMGLPLDTKAAWSFFTRIVLTTLTLHPHKTSLIKTE